MPDYKYITYESLDKGDIVRIMLNRPDARNAQNRGLLVELDDAFLAAEADDQVRVVILGGMGPMFSSGHDMGSKEALAEREGPDRHPTTLINGGTRKGAEARMLQEWHYYFENTKRWRNLRKITIAQVHGTVYAAGLMLMWACDLIVAADNARLRRCGGDPARECAGWSTSPIPGSSDPARPRSSCSPATPWRSRKRTPWAWSPRSSRLDELSERTLEFARRIAALPTMTALLIKESVNQSVDNMGFYNALQACFTLHQLNHSHWAEMHDNKYPVALPEDGMDWRTAPPVVPAVKNLVRAPAPARN